VADHSAAHLPITTDCSGFAEMMARWSGAADPSGAGFDGSGNTDTMLAHSQHIPRAETQPGDFAVFGLNPSQHVVVLTQSAAAGNGAMCVSHGRQGDPVQGGPNPYCPLDVDGDFGPDTTKALQWRLGVDQDGDFGRRQRRACSAC
jgi:hypothetical protein